MTQNRKLFLNLYWHMHQPDYRDHLTGEFILPWTYLHAIKDYTDMAYHLEQNPDARATFNFVPILLEQLEDYTRQFAEGRMRDPLLALFTVGEDVPLTAEQRKLIVESCFKSNHTKLIAPFPAYSHLYELFRMQASSVVDACEYFSDQYMWDLLMWYHLAWTGESVRRESELVARLMGKGSMFTVEERNQYFVLLGELVSGIIPRYRALAERGQIEISSTPDYHPILPLLLDFKSAHDTMPDAALPQNERYPGGLARAQAHVDAALESHRQRFGHTPSGMWPAEGGVSQAALLLLAEKGVKWAATGESVLGNSLYKAYQQALPDQNQYLYKPYQVSDGTHAITCFFRNDMLSDKIGFEYSKWYAEDAVKDFVQELERIYASTNPDISPVVSVILDGENAWEYYPYNAYYFLSQLYAKLAEHPNIVLATPGEITAHCENAQASEGDFAGVEIKVEPLPAVAAGSWVYGTFSTWIGSPDKNRGWDLLCEAKKNYDLVMAGTKLTDRERAQATRQLADCEGSDWFWWFGDYNSAQSVASFDSLYRRNLTNLYRLLKLPIPKVLDSVISVGAGNPEAGGAMRRGQE
ncbi:MAG: glycoside hydrolase [Methylobacillus sp.]|jgi:alpha-amylase/alpha-mannosidase (GH57 family)|nr:glycoside hydrolase [Methylobacillus sp.]